MRDERGQAAILAVCLIAIAAVVMGGLRVAQTALLARAVERRAGEAAVEAATAVVADAYATEMRARLASADSRDITSVIGDATTREAARIGASDMSLRNGGESVSDLAVACDAGAVTVTITLRGTVYRASFGAPECSRP